MTAPTNAELNQIIQKICQRSDMANDLLNIDEDVQLARHQLRNIQRLLNDTWPPEPDAIGHDWTAEIPF